MRFFLFMVALVAACLGILAVVFRRELRPHLETFAHRRRRRRAEARAAEPGPPATGESGEAQAKSKSKRPPKAEKPPEPKRINGMVSGVTFTNSDGQDRQTLIRKHCREGTVITLAQEPNNPHDPNAVAVFVRGAQIGYLSTEDAARATKYLGLGWSADAEVVRIYGGTEDKPSLGVNHRIILHPPT